MARPALGASGTTLLINLVRAPATLLVYAAGVAAAAADNWDRVAMVLTTAPTTAWWGSGSGPAALTLSPSNTLGSAPATRIRESMTQLFEQELMIGDEAYADAWDRFEYTRLVAQFVWEAREKRGQSIGSNQLRVAGYYDSYEPIASSWFREQVAADARFVTELTEKLAGGERELLLDASGVIDRHMADMANSQAMSNRNVNGGAVWLPPGPWRPCV